MARRRSASCGLACIARALQTPGSAGHHRRNRAGFIEGDVGSRLAAAQVVIVHCRQVIVHQGIGVDQLHCAGGRIGARRRAVRASPGGVGQQRAYAHRPPLNRLSAHGCVEALQFRAWAAQERFQGRIDRLWQLPLVGRNHACWSASKGDLQLAVAPMRICTFSSAWARPPGNHGSGARLAQRCH